MIKDEKKYIHVKIAHLIQKKKKIVPITNLFQFQPHWKVR